MENFSAESAEALERAANTVGAYLGWFQALIEHLNRDIDNAPLGFWKRRAAKTAMRRIEKEFAKQERDFKAVIEELSKLPAVLEADQFIERCSDVRRMVTPLFAKTKYASDAVSKITALVRFSTKKGE